MRIKEQRKQLIKRRSTLLNAESARVITRPHIPGDGARIKTLIGRVSMLSDEDVQHLLDAVIQDFSGRHRNFRGALQRNFERVAVHVPAEISLSPEQQLLLGSYFTAEYSVEAAALFNPSIVPHPDQKGVAKGSQRFVMSFRATGEGHVSSIEFRSGMVDENHDIYFDPISQYVATPEMHTDPVYHRLHFQRKLVEMGVRDRIVNLLLEGLGETFTFDELNTQIRSLRSTKFRLKPRDRYSAVAGPVKLRSDIPSR
jgi:hypothetical protein